MAVNTDFIGRTYPPTAPYAVSRAKIREFAEAVGATDPVHTDVEAARAAGHADVIATPTFAVMIGQQCDAQYVADPEAGVDYSRVVHGEQRFIHHRPMVAGDEITGTLTIDSIRQAGGHSMVTMRSELNTLAGAPVATSLSTIVVRGGE
ncbi:MAG: MaoC family dehydratase N-terminal domain-containing protein [Micrococcales bacterium]|nr:MaoC family dehydratase N-terminal domain-containing protein [Micrococcales bacterium]